MNSMVEDAEKTSDFIIFVLVSPRDYRDAVKNAGNIAVTVGDRLKLDHAHDERLHTYNIPNWSG